MTDLVVAIYVPRPSTLSVYLDQYGPWCFKRGASVWNGGESKPGVRPRVAEFDTDLFALHLKQWMGRPDNEKSEREWLRAFSGSLVEEQIARSMMSDDPDW